MNEIPHVLYKYFSPERIDVLSSGRIRISKAHTLNDPFEMLPRFDEFVKETANEADLKMHAFGELEWNDVKRIRKTQQRKDREKAFISEKGAKFQRQFGNRFGLLSFSSSIDSPVMWGHYSRDHTGFAVGFSTSSPFFSNELVRIAYGSTRPHVHRGEYKAILQVKNEEWTYESEWRVYRSFDAAEEDSDDWHFEAFPFDAVTHIYFGLRSSSVLMHEAIGAFNSRNLKCPPFSRMRLHDCEFKLVPEVIQNLAALPEDWTI